jgi:hypothetical protein
MIRHFTGNFEKKYLNRIPEPGTISGFADNNKKKN